MRIISGKYRGKKLFSPKDFTVRPTEDRVKEAVFNILYSIVGPLEGKTFLDVFAGTGAIGFEALSRGAKNVCLIDKDTQTLLRNADFFLKDKNAFELMHTDVLSLKKAKQPFDIVFSDAPYDMGLNEKALLTLQTQGYLKNGTIVIVETRKNETLQLDKSFELKDERIYGMAKISFYTFLA